MGNLIGKNVNEVDQVPNIVSVDKVTPVRICEVNERRTKLRVTLPDSAVAMRVIIAPTSALALALKGEPIQQQFPSNDNPYLPQVAFDTDSSSQGEKWAVLDPASLPATVDITVNEYIG